MSKAEVPVLDSARVGHEPGDEKPGFSLRGVEFRFRPAGNPDAYARMNNSDTDEGLLQAADDFITATLLDHGLQDWHKLRTEGDPPLWFDEIVAVARHIAGVTAARPTMPSSGSSATPPPNGTGSTAGSSSPAAVPSPA